jgi:hypothetical protein
MILQNGAIFLLAPSFFADIGIQMVTPSFSTLLSYPAGQNLCNFGPLAWAVDTNVFFYGSVFFGSPWALD